MRHTALALVAVCGIAAAAGLEARQTLTKQDADTMERKVSAIIDRGNQAPPKASKPLRTVFTDREVNAYFKYNSQSFMPVGVLEPTVTIGEAGLVKCRAIVDLDVVRKSKVRGWSDPLTYVTGRVEVLASGTLQAADGKGIFNLQSAYLAGVPIPKSVLQEVISFYTRSQELPQGFDLEKPFELPQKIRQVDLQRGTAIVLQ